MFCQGTAAGCPNYFNYRSNPIYRVIAKTRTKVLGRLVLAESTPAGCATLSMAFSLLLLLLFEYLSNNDPPPLNSPTSNYCLALLCSFYGFRGTMPVSSSGVALNLAAFPYASSGAVGSSGLPAKASPSAIIGMRSERNYLIFFILVVTCS